MLALWGYIRGTSWYHVGVLDGPKIDHTHQPSATTEVGFGGSRFGTGVGQRAIEASARRLGKQNVRLVEAHCAAWWRMVGASLGFFWASAATPQTGPRTCRLAPPSGPCLQKRASRRRETVIFESTMKMGTGATRVYVFGRQGRIEMHCSVSDDAETE